MIKIGAGGAEQIYEVPVSDEEQREDRRRSEEHGGARSDYLGIRDRYERRAVRKGGPFCLLEATVGCGSVA